MPGKRAAQRDGHRRANEAIPLSVLDFSCNGVTQAWSPPRSRTHGHSRLAGIAHDPDQPLVLHLHTDKARSWLKVGVIEVVVVRVEPCAARIAILATNNANAVDDDDEISVRQRPDVFGKGCSWSDNAINQACSSEVIA